MIRRSLLALPLLLATGLVLAADAPETQEPAKEAPTPAVVPAAPPPKPQEPTSEAEPAMPKQEAATGEKAASADAEQAPAQTGPKRISGMSILGNQEAPKSLVIVPWKSSVIGDEIDLSTMLDDSRQPIDREVFLRALSYYAIRSERKP